MTNPLCLCGCGREVRLSEHRYIRHHYNASRFKKGHKPWNLILSSELQPFYGKKHTNEYKENMSELHIGERNPMYNVHLIPWNKNLTKETDQSIARQSEKISGINHVNWKGGISRRPYGFEFNKELKEEIRERDNYTCQLCGSSKNLFIHHIDYDKKNNNPENLVTLCIHCNGRMNFNREYWENYWR